MEFFAARQPIFDIKKSVYAYELLFRDSLDNVFPQGMDDNEATSKIIEGLQFNLGLDTLTHNKPAFINFTHDTLLERYPLLLPKEQVVVEILETVKPGKKLLEACQELKSKGYVLALDDYEHQEVWKHFYPLVDIIKIDYKLTTLDEIKYIIEAIQDFPHIKLLAEKVENYDEFNQAVELGFCYFQGYFFSKPEVIQSRHLTPSHTAIANLMSELSSPAPDMNKSAHVFETDVNLSFKLLRYAQSPLFKRQSEISNIKQAVVMLGQDELRRFASLMFSAQFSHDKPEELTAMSLLRARFCESLAQLPNQTEDKSCAFLVGLLSLLDAMLDAELTELLDKLPLSDKIKDALCEDKGMLSQYLHLVAAFERADWERAQQISTELKIDWDNASLQYKLSLEWVDQRLEMM